MKSLRTYPILLSLALLLSASSAAPGPKPEPRVRFDGIYEQYPAWTDSSDNEHRWYLRFYEDGVVIQKEAITPPDKWTSKLTRENEKIDKGTYKQTGDRLTYEFAGRGERMSTSYTAEGVVLPGDKLKLTVKMRSVLDGRSAGSRDEERTLAFLKIDAGR